MNENEFNCARCAVTEKICQSEGGAGPAWCPTKKGRGAIEAALKDYDDPPVREFARVASVQEGACYANRERKPYVPFPPDKGRGNPSNSPGEWDFTGLGLVFCTGVREEARVLADILEGPWFRGCGRCV